MPVPFVRGRSSPFVYVPVKRVVCVAIPSSVRGATVFVGEFLDPSPIDYLPIPAAIALANVHVVLDAHVAECSAAAVYMLEFVFTVHVVHLAERTRVVMFTLMFFFFAFVQPVTVLASGVTRAHSVGGMLAKITARFSHATFFVLVARALLVLAHVVVVLKASL